MLSVAFSHSSSSYLTLQMEARTGQLPQPAPSTPSSFSATFNMVWLLVPSVPISLSSCLLLFTALSFMPGRPFPHSPPPPQSSITPMRHTHTRETPRQDYSTLFPVHPLLVALPVPALMRHTSAYKGHTLTLCVV